MKDAYTVIVSVRLPREVVDKIDAEAEKMDATRAWVVKRTLLQNFRA